MNKKNVFQIIFASLAIILGLLPFTASVNDLMTRIIMKIGWYVLIQDQIVPGVVRLAGAALLPLGISVVAYPHGLTANGIYAHLSWNCIGWQSMFLFFATTIVGFRNSTYTWRSIFEALAIGIMGTFLINLMRICITIVLLTISRPLYAVVYHDYLAALVTIIWLIGYWWFVFRYVLVEKENMNEVVPKQYFA